MDDFIDKILTALSWIMSVVMPILFAGILIGIFSIFLLSIYRVILWLI